MVHVCLQYVCTTIPKYLEYQIGLCPTGKWSKTSDIGDNDTQGIHPQIYIHRNKRNETKGTWLFFQQKPSPSRRCKAQKGAAGHILDSSFPAHHLHQGSRSLPHLIESPSHRVPWYFFWYREKKNGRLIQSSRMKNPWTRIFWGGK